MLVLYMGSGHDMLPFDLLDEASCAEQNSIQWKKRAKSSVPPYQHDIIDVPLGTSDNTII